MIITLLFDYYQDVLLKGCFVDYEWFKDSRCKWFRVDEFSEWKHIIWLDLEMVVLDDNILLCWMKCVCMISKSTKKGELVKSHLIQSNQIYWRSRIWYTWVGQTSQQQNANEY